MKNNKEDKKILKYVKKLINSSFDIFNTDAFLCSAYFLDYVYHDNIESLIKYKSKFEDLSYEDKKKTLQYVIVNLLEQSKNKQKDKIKEKK